MSIYNVAQIYVERKSNTWLWNVILENIIAQGEEIRQKAEPAKPVHISASKTKNKDLLTMCVNLLSCWEISVWFLNFLYSSVSSYTCLWLLLQYFTVFYTKLTHRSHVVVGHVM